MNEIINNLITRRSSRSYSSKEIPDELLSEVLKAGLYAPSGMNRQAVKLVLIKDKKTRDTLSRLNAKAAGWDNDPFYGAPYVIVAFADSNVFTYIEDGSLAIGNMLNAAASLGLGSCWIHRAREVFDSPEGRAIAEAWGIPASYKGIGNCILGYTDEKCASKPRNENRIIII